MNVREARALAQELGYRIEKYRGEDAWLVRDLHTDIRVGHRLTWAGLVQWLEREVARRNLVWQPGDIQIIRRDDVTIRKETR